MKKILTFIFSAILVLGMVSSCLADLAEMKARGELRHLGVPYANFVTGDGEGLDTEIIRLYCSHIGVNYRYVKTDWNDVIGDLSGKKIELNGATVKVVGDVPVKGDIIGNGLTVIPWRKEILDYSVPYFPSAIWVIARSDSQIQPIGPTSDINRDAEKTRSLLKGRNVLSIRNTCVDLKLYGLEEARPLYKEGITLNDLAAVLIKGDAEISILDVPDALVALTKFPGKIKILGAITGPQSMGFGIAKESPQLLASFNEFLEQLKASGKLTLLIQSYYPGIEKYFPKILQH
jgi:ABC-type amino acid transport substrate-binding protein